MQRLQILTRGKSGKKHTEMWERAQALENGITLLVGREMGVNSEETQDEAERLPGVKGSACEEMDAA